ncbi:protein ENHANCED DISEASE RESISTANCE 2 isoform X2 [Selaginella moellendorffii]|uniref:protein ENHANCED DISEASE RESISTANCE 2 isoform X2 n=1 Tax=Selaginella moellendorffii TaxID=88036 RepID=UPI000D1C71D0|nr:protein ENHANCED DISEASE RESISTANCE 2 isoform X2 [Selaginella moellendorffii]|eukprot:XP_024540187.1 protein ENHANCED DISEASE RESISTANCE 2 isoform X2 [Selaginella moellendorffii]
MTRQGSWSMKRLRTIGKVAPVVEPGTPEAFPDPPKWRLVRCENGLRFFKEMCRGSKVSVMKAVGVVKGQADLIFDEIMNYGPERFQWDHTVETASIVEVIDDHSDVLHVCLTQDWRYLSPRDFCISRYWKREDNGAYTIFYRSVDRKATEPGHVRATIHSGGYMITPLTPSKCMVESVFEIDAGGWPGCITSSYGIHLRDNLLSVIAGVRDYFAAHRMNSTQSNMMPRPRENSIVVTEEPVAASNIPQRIASTPFLGSSDMEDFFDARADQFSDTESHSDVSDERLRNAKAYNGHSDGLQKWCSFSGTLSRGVGRNSVSEPDSSLFKLRGKRYLRDGLLVAAEEPIFKLVAADWYKSKDKLDNVSCLRGISESKDAFFFTFNLQVPHSGHYYSLVFYFATRTKILEGSLLHQFIHKDDNFRNQRLLLLPSVPEGSWIVRQAVGSRAVVLGQILDCSYHKGKNYIEVDVNMGSSGIVRGVMSIVFGYISALVVDMGFSLRAESESELPEELLGAVRCFRLDLSTAANLER